MSITPDEVTKALNESFSRMDEEYRDILIPGLKDRVNIILKLGHKIEPVPADWLRAFELCPWKKLKVILIGQDPYPTGADGLAFSIRGTTIPPSLKNIFECLEVSGFGEHTSGDLSSWARQGVLLLNMALTTEQGHSGAHLKYWDDYMTLVLEKITKVKNNLCIILLGSRSQGKRSRIIGNQTILEWGHPSPINRHNTKKDNPKHFRNCTVFTETNSKLKSMGLDPIIW